MERRLELFLEDQEVAFINTAPFVVYPYASTYQTSSSDGGFGGGQLGYNLQTGPLVFGIETDFQRSGISGKTSAQVVPDAANTNVITGVGAAAVRSDLDWFGTVRGRFGYAFGNVLVYGTAGFAFGQISDSLFVSDHDANTASAGKTSAQTGYVVGAGVEYAINPLWSLKGEYQYIDLGSTTLYADTNPGFAEGGDATVRVVHAYNTMRVGLDYHVSTAYLPLK